MQISTYSNEELVSKLLYVKSKLETLKKDKLALEAELQKRALPTMLDTNTQSVLFKNSGKGVLGSARVTTAYTLDVINYEVLCDALGKGVSDTFIQKSESTSYTIKANLKKALIAICEKDYDFSCSMEDAFESLGATTEQQEVLLKKLKGDYFKDNETLSAIFGDGNYDEELYYVYKYKNTELIKKFFPGITEDGLENLRNVMSTEAKISVTAEALE